VKVSVPVVAFAASLVAGFALALIPNLHGDLYGFVPSGLRHWIYAHDDAANISAFLVLSIFALCFRRESRRDAADTGRIAPARIFERRGMRVAGLMALVGAIEFAQIFIPGRVAELHDVCTGWSGIFAGWLIAVLLDARTERRAASRAE